MKPQRTPLLLSGMMIGEMKETFTFREITAIGELEAAFRFRYEEYSFSRMSVYLKENEHRIDMDVYDLHSRHYGLFRNDGTLTGYLRVVFDRGTCYNRQVFELGRRFAGFSESSHSEAQLKKLPAADFPFLSYSFIPESVRLQYAELKNRGEGFAEASRLIISRHSRGIKLFAFLMECAMILFIRICEGKKNAMVHCCRDHGIFYKRYGFLPFHADAVFEDSGITKTLMYLPQTVSPKNLPAKTYELAADFGRSGRIMRVME